MNNLIIQVVALVIVSFSSVTMSADPPKVPGTFYDDGPQSPFYAAIELSTAEKVAYALLEGVIEMAESKINATSCSSAEGSSSIEIFTDGSEGNRFLNFVEVVSLGGSILLDANVRPVESFRGQRIEVNQQGFGILAGTLVLNYRGRMAYNKFNNMLWSYSQLDVMGNSGFTNRDLSKVIKEFKRGSNDKQNHDYYTITSWGLQALERLGYPVNKYWHRLKSRHSDGDIGRTVFVLDRLVGATSCRIVVDIEGDNTLDFFWQRGTLVISKDIPAAPVAAFNEAPFM